MTNPSSFSIRALLSASVGLVTLALAGCDLAGGPTPTPVRFHVPTTVSVIESVDYSAPDRQVRVILESGESRELDLNEVEGLRNSQDPRPGWLYMDSTTDGEPWYMVIPPSHDAFTFSDRAIDRVDEVLFSFGLLLPKADGFHDSGLGTLSLHAGVTFYINEKGEVEADL